MLFLAILIGILIGAGVGVLLAGNNDLIFIDILFGLAGAVGGYVLVGLTSDSDTIFSFSGLLGAAVGASIAVFILNALHKLFDRHQHQSRPGSDL